MKSAYIVNKWEVKENNIHRNDIYSEDSYDMYFFSNKIIKLYISNNKIIH